MTKKTAVLVGTLVALMLAALTPVAHTDTARPMLVRVHVDSRADAALLMSSFDETHNHSAGEIELLLWPGDRVELDALGYDYDVVTEDLFARDQALEAETPHLKVKLPGPDRSDYRRLTDYNSEMKKLAKSHPRLVDLFKMPRKSLEGRTIYGVEIAARVNQKLDGRPIFYMDGVHHAREWPASEYSMLYVHYLVEQFGKNPEISKLLRRARVIIVPIINVDGFNYSRESVLSYNDELRGRTSATAAGNGFEGYWRKNRRSLTGEDFPTPDNPDAYGVDPNRNYPYLWGDSHGGSSGNHFDQTYRGEAPFSEPESRNVGNLILSRPVTGVITNHTYQGSVLRAGGGKAPEDGILRRIGQKMANILRYRNAPTVGYPTTGTTDDWAYSSMGALGFTIEHGFLGFHPPYQKEVGAFWRQHMKAFTTMLKASASPRYHSIIKGRVAGGPARLTITKSFRTRLSPGNPTGKKSIPERIKMRAKTRPNGTFAWHVSPSSRPYEKKAEAFTLRIRSKRGTKTMRVFVRRGQVRKLGTIRL